jgi:hypothetical protein
VHLVLKRLVDANTAVEEAKAALMAAEDHRRQCALDMAKIEDDEERRTGAVWAYLKFGKGLSLALAEAVTGLPGRSGQSAFLVMAGRKEYQPKGSWLDQGAVVAEDPAPLWPDPDALERDVIRTHIAHKTPYLINEGLGWTKLMLQLDPSDAELFLNDPTAGVAQAAGVTRDELIEWLSTSGAVRCDALTKAGHRCHNGVAGVGHRGDLWDWKTTKDKGGYCSSHGG